jgi:phosphohistidine swiveling domain-containing protein
MKRYGHLRPGTYDIMSKRYDQIRKINQGIFFKKSKPKNKKFKFTKVQIKRINTLLKKNNFDNFKAQDLVNYIKKSIIGREYGKFIFTRSLSKVLELIASYAKIIGLTREEISYVPINLIIKNIKNKNNKFHQKKILLKNSKQNKDKNKISAMIRLPQILINISDVFIVPFQVSHPNFITNKKITGKILIIINKINKYDLANKIIVVEGADPGYDWIFSQKIKGLITKYGGANSHMAIRCAEFGVPAAIGCGEQRYEKIIESNNIHLDCAAGVINIIG